MQNKNEENNIMKESIISPNTIPSEILDFLNKVFVIIEIRALVGKENGVNFIVHSNEQNHSLPHVHAKYGEYEISIDIELCKAIAGNLPPKQTRFAEEWVKKNQEKLRGDWKTYAISGTFFYNTMSGLKK